MKLPKKIKDLIPKYSYRIEWDEQDKIYVVCVEELSGCMTHGDTMEEAIKMGFEAAQLHVESLYELGEEVPTPISMQKYRGEFIIRGTPDLHRKIAQAAARNNKTLNKFVLSVLEDKVG